MNLTSDDVRDIVELLDSLPYDELRLKTASFTLTLRRAPGGGWTQDSEELSPPHVVDAALGASAGGAVAGSQNGPAPAPPGPAGAATVAATTGAERRRSLGDVRAPLPGTFYRAPRPGAAPYVEVGDHVDEHTVVGIIETMKLMNPLYAGAPGTVIEICLADAQFAEEDTVLMRVDTADP